MAEKYDPYSFTPTDFSNENNIDAFIAATEAKTAPMLQENLTLDEIAERKKARLSAKHDQAGSDSDLTLAAKSTWNTVNNLWGGKDFTANVEGQEVGMTNKIFEDSDTTMEQSLVHRQELINQYNAAEDDPNARFKVYQLRLNDGYDEAGNPLYTYKTGISPVSAAARYKDQYIRDGYEILSEKGFAGAEDWENKWHGNKANLADRTYDSGFNTAGESIRDTAQLDKGYTEIYNTQFFNKNATPEQIANNQAFSQMLSDANDANYNGGQYNVIDAAQSGFAKAGVSSADFVLDVLTPGGNNDWLDNAKKQENIDKWVGYNRVNATKTLGEATGYWKQGNYVSAITEVLKNPEITAESLGMMAEMLVGFGKFTKIGKLASRATEARAAGNIVRAEKIDKKIASGMGIADNLRHKVLSNAGFLTVVGEQANNSLEERKINNNGKEPTMVEIMAVTAEKVLELGLDRIAFGKITGLDGGKRMLQDAFSSSTLIGKKRFLAKIGETAAGLSAAGATEAAQEFTQNWGQILSEQLGTEKHPGGLAAILTNQENIDEVLGATLAGAAGGVHMGAPGQVYGLGKDTFNSEDTRVKGDRTKYSPSAVIEIADMTLDEEEGIFDTFDTVEAQGAATNAIIEETTNKLADPKRFLESGVYEQGQNTVRDYLQMNVQKIARINKIDPNDEEAMGVITAGVLSKLNDRAIERIRNGEDAAPTMDVVEETYERALDGLEGINRQKVLDMLITLHERRLSDTLGPELAQMARNEDDSNAIQGLSTSAKAKALAVIQRMGSVGNNTDVYTPEDLAYFQQRAQELEVRLDDVGKNKNSHQVEKEIFETGFSFLGRRRLSMKEHTQGIVDAALTGKSTKQPLTELDSFLQTRNIGKTAKTEVWDEAQGKSVPLSYYQLDRHMSTIIENNERIADIIKTEMLAPISKRGSKAAQDTTTELQAMLLNLDENTQEIKDKQKAHRANENTSGDLNMIPEEINDIGYSLGKEHKALSDEINDPNTSPEARQEALIELDGVQQEIDSMLSRFSSTAIGSDVNFMNGVDMGKSGVERPANPFDDNELITEESTEAPVVDTETPATMTEDEANTRGFDHGNSVSGIIAEMRDTSNPDMDQLNTDLAEAEATSDAMLEDLKVMDGANSTKLVDAYEAGYAKGYANHPIPEAEPEVAEDIEEEIVEETEPVNEETVETTEIPVETTLTEDVGTIETTANVEPTASDTPTVQVTTTKEKVQALVARIGAFKKGPAEFIRKWSDGVTLENALLKAGTKASQKVITRIDEMYAEMTDNRPSTEYKYRRKPNPQAEAAQAASRANNEVSEDDTTGTDEVFKTDKAVEESYSVEDILELERLYDEEQKAQEQEDVTSTEETRSDTKETTESTEDVGQEQDTDGTDNQQRGSENRLKPFVNKFMHSKEWRQLVTELIGLRKRVTSFEGISKQIKQHTANMINDQRVLQTTADKLNELQQIRDTNIDLPQDAYNREERQKRIDKVNERLLKAIAEQDAIIEKVIKRILVRTTELAVLERAQQLKTTKRQLEAELDKDLAGSQLMAKAIEDNAQAGKKADGKPLFKDPSKIAAFVKMVKNHITDLLKVNKDTSKLSILDLDVTINDLMTEADANGNLVNQDQILALLPKGIKERIFINGTTEEKLAFMAALQKGNAIMQNTEIKTDQRMLVGVTADHTDVIGNVYPIVETNAATGVVTVKYVERDADGKETEFDLYETDKDGNKTQKYFPNPIALLSKLMNKGGVRVTDGIATEIQDAIKLEMLQTMRSMAEVSVKKGDERERYISDVFGVDPSDAAYTELSNMLTEGKVPESAFVQSAGKNVLRSLRLSILGNVDAKLADSITTALGLMVIEAVKNSTHQEGRESTTFNSGDTITISDSSADGKIVQTVRDDAPANGKHFRIMNTNLNDKTVQLITEVSSAYEYLGIDGDRTQVQLDPPADLEYGKKTYRGQSIEVAGENQVDYINAQQKLPRKFTAEFEKLFAEVKERVEYNNKNTEAKDHITINDVFYDMLLVSEEQILNKPYLKQATDVKNNAANKLIIDNMITTYQLVNQPNGDTLPFYLAWDVTVSGRYMIENQMMNPQNSKITRFIVEMEDMKSTMPVAKDGKGYDADHITMFKGAASQSLGLGIDKETSESVFKELEEKYFKLENDGTVTYPENSPIKPVVEAYKEGTEIDLSFLPTNERFHAYQLVAALAQFESAEGKAFDHSLVIEMDAVTSGMILTLLQIGTNEAMDYLKKGGIYVVDSEGNSEFKTHQQFLDEGGIDIYRTPAEIVAEELAIRNAKKAGDGYDGKTNIEKLVEAFVIKGKDKNWRNLMKYLVMYYIYGASINTIKKNAGITIGVETVSNALGQYKGMAMHDLFMVAYPNFRGQGKERSAPQGETAEQKVEREKAKILLTTILRSYNSQYAEATEGQEFNRLYTNLFANTTTPSLEDLYAQLAQGIEYKAYKSGTDFYSTKDEMPEDGRIMHTVNNLVLSQEMQASIAKQTSNAYGDIIEKAFNKAFPFLNRFREALKSVEIVNFTVFKYKLKQELEKYKAEAGTDTVQISKEDFNKILVKLSEQGYGYTSQSINEGANQDYMKYDNEAGDYVGVDGALRDGAIPFKNRVGKSGASYNKVPGMNIGANGVIDIHEIDAFLMSISDSASFQNIYDAYIMGVNMDKIVKTHGEYNGGVLHTARTHDIMGNAVAKTENSLSELIANGELKDFKKFLAEQNLTQQLSDGLSRINKDFDINEVFSILTEMDEQRSENLNKEYDVNHLQGIDTVPSVRVGKDTKKNTKYVYSKIKEVLTTIIENTKNLADANIEYNIITEDDAVVHINKALDKYLSKEQVTAYQDQLVDYMNDAC